MWLGFVLVFIVLVTLTMFSLLSTKLALQYHTTDSISYKVSAPLATVVLLLLGQDKPEVAVVADTLDHFIVLASILLAMVPALAYRRIKKALEEKQGLRSVKVETLGADDLRVMASHYRGAESVVVTSGDFSWLGLNLMLKGEVERLANDGAIKLVTWKTCDDIERQIGDRKLFGKIRTCITEDPSKSQVKCSFLRYRGGERRLLYLYDRVGEDEVAERDYFVGIIVEQHDTRYLLRALETLCRPAG